MWSLHFCSETQFLDTIYTIKYQKDDLNFLISKSNEKLQILLGKITIIVIYKNLKSNIL